LISYLSEYTATSITIMIIFFVVLFATAVFRAAAAAPSPNDKRIFYHSSEGEQALFGCIHTEDCLFGSSSHLFGIPPPTAKEEKEKIGATKPFSVKETTGDNPRGGVVGPAFMPSQISAFGAD